MPKKDKKAQSFLLENMTGTLKKGKRSSDFTNSLNRLLVKFCGTEWSYRFPDEGVWS